MALSKVENFDIDSDDNAQIINVHLEIEDLRDEILIKIFDYLNCRDLRRVACVSKRWNYLASQSTYWTRFDTFDLGFSHSNILQILRKVPLYITHMRILLQDDDSIGVSLPELSEIIYRRCKNLKELYFENCMLSEFEIWNALEGYQRGFIMRSDVGNIHFNSPAAVQTPFIHPLIFLPPSLRLLSFRHVWLSTPSLLLRVASQKTLPNLEVLDFSTRLVDGDGHCPPLLCSCQNLKEVHLPQTILYLGLDSYVRCFRNIKILNLEDAGFTRNDLSKLHGYVGKLEEFYLCKLPLRDDHLQFVNEKTFPKLKIICLKTSDVSIDLVKNLFRLCKSLKTVVANVTDDSDRITFGYYEYRKNELSFFAISDCSEVHCKNKHHINSIKRR